MKKLKKISRRLSAFVMTLVLTISLFHNYAMAASDYITVDNKSGYFYVTIKDDTTGKSDRIRIDVSLGGKFGGSKQDRTTAETTVSAKINGSKGNNYNLTVNNNYTKNGLYYTAKGNYAIAIIGVSFKVPAHTSYQRLETDKTSGKCNVHDSVSGARTNPTYTNFDTHETSEKTKNFIVAVNLMNMGINLDDGTIHTNMTVHIARNSYSVKYNLNGGSFALGYNTTHTAADGRTQKKNPTTVTDGGDKGFTNTYFYVEHPAKTGYTFTGWDISEMDNDTHGIGTSNGMYYCSMTTVNTLTTAVLKDSTYIPYSFKSLRKTAGTVNFAAMYVPNTYYVKYDGNGATAGQMTKTEFKYDTAGNLAANSYAKVGYKFLGWSTNKNAAAPEYANGQSVKNLTSKADDTVTMYAVWQKNNSSLSDSNVLKNAIKILKVNVVKVDEEDSSKTLNATFDVYEWSAKAGDGYGAYKKIPSFSIDSNKEYKFTYTADNQGKFKIKETSVEAPYVNAGDEAEIDMSKNCIDIPFYENTMVDEDKGVFIMGIGYEKGDIVRDSADKDSATYYLAKTANAGKELHRTAYWQKLDNSYEKYDRLITGAGKWDAADTYARTFSIEFGNKERHAGLNFGLRKKDPRGSLLEGAEFNVYYADDGNNKFRTMGYRSGKYSTDITQNGVFDKNFEIPLDDRQTHAVNIDADHKTLELIIKEDKAPDNYNKIDDFKVKAYASYDSIEGRWVVDYLIATFSDGSTQRIDNGGVFDCDQLTDEPYKLNLTVVKKGDKGNYKTSDLAGAEYTVYADEALTQPVTFIEIGSNGKGKAEGLDLKDYWLKETKVPTSGKFKLSDEVRHVKVTPDGTQTVFDYEAEFEEDEDSGMLKVHKVDMEGNEVNGAGFTLYECPADITEEEAASYDCSELKAISEATVKDGYATFNDIPFGRYILSETKVPDGYTKAPNQIVTVNLENKGNSEYTAAFTTVVEEEETFRAKILKVDATDHKKLKGAVFKIYDITTGAYLKQTLMTSDEEGNAIETQEDALYTTDENGLIIADGLSKHSYRIEEISAPEGYILDAAPQIITISDGNESGVDKDDVPYYEVTFKDHKTETTFTKVDITTKKEITGGKYHVEDLEGNIIDEWVGDGKPHKVYGLIPGNTYLFHEEAAPEGYTITSDVEFTVKEDGTVTEVVMEDDYIKLDLSKADITSDEELPGAVLELYDSENNLIETWVSGATPHRIERIKVGTYTLVEKSAPKGYLIADSITFEVGETGEVQTVVMKDDYTKTEFIKLASDTAEPLVGCVLQILDSNKKVVTVNGKKAEWITDGTPYEIDYLTAGETYYLHEVSAPSDYQLADDIEFVAGKPWTDGKSQTDKDYNIPSGSEYEDQGGNVVNYDDGVIHVPESVTENEPETSEPETEDDSDDIDGEIEEVDVDDLDIPKDDDSEYTGELISITMVDKPKLVSILKKTDAGDLLEGAELELIDDATGNVLYSFTTSADVESVFKLKNGKYTIHEKYAPENFELAEDIHFEVTDDTTEVEYEMIDKYTGSSLKVVKLDENTKKPIEGVEFTLTGESGLTLKASTDANGEITFGMKDGRPTLPPQKYTLTETSAKEGYSLLKDSIVVELPLKLTKAEAEAEGADLSQAKWDKDNEVYRFFDLTYQVSDGATLQLPSTGYNNLKYGLLAGAGIMILVGLYFGIEYLKRSFWR